MTILIIAAISVLIIISSITAYHLFKLNQQQTAQIISLQNQLSILCTGTLGTDDRIEKFEKTLNLLKEQHHKLSLSTSASPQAYDHAIRLARKGVSINQLIDNCNLTDEEAHLISHLHGEAAKSSGLH